jgi:hypothetical protein
MRHSCLFMLAILILAIMTTESHAQRLIIRMNNGNENAEPLNTVQKLHFSNNELIVDFVSGSDITFPLTDIRKLYFDATVSIDDNTIPDLLKLTVFPNPAGDFITIKGIPADAGLISIFSMEGGLLLTRPVTTNYENIDISGLPNGLYLVNVPGYTSKFIKK